MSYEGYINYQCQCGKIDEGCDAYGPQPMYCECGKEWLYVQDINTTNNPVFVGD